MRTDFKTWFAAARAKALAVVLLTRRDDLEVEETSGDMGPDFTVRIKSPDGSGPCSFGVLLRSTLSPVTIKQANARLRPTLNGLPREGEVLMPVSVFYYPVKDDQGYYTWGHEPVIERGRAKLRRQGETDCRALDNEAVE